ncbi:MAG: hypothetical protein G01um101431_316 [Parcubacteria group bacterium Gr01-1014_31]|nr:MAG: hypothetical protein G01um101431_316 [Parcubacteria group bacterium Gr01-1014_31]
MFDFLRSTHSTVAVFVGVVLFVLVFAWVLIRWVSTWEEVADKVSMQRQIRFWRNTALAVAAVVFVIALANIAVVNETPRSTIDRSSVNQQADDYEQHVKEKAGEAKK